MSNQYSLDNVETLIKGYSNAIELGNAALFIGSGISVGLGKDSWVNLLEEASKSLGIDIEKSGISYPEIAQFWIDEDKNNKRELRNKICDLLEIKRVRPSYKNSVYNQICNLDIRDVWTTNYDQIIESAYSKLTHKDVTVIAKDEAILNLSGREDVRIYKMHGSVDNVESMIITSNEYFTYKRKRPFFSESLYTHLLHKTFLFVGFSFDDPNIKSILQTLKDHLDQIGGDNHDAPRSHYLILYSQASSDEDKRIEQYKIRSLSKLGIKTYVVSRSGEKITRILSQIRKYTTRKNVVIAGSCRYPQGDIPWKPLPELSTEIGKRIINSNNCYNLHTCYGEGVGRDSIEGALSECAARLIEDASDRIRIWPTYEKDGISDSDKIIVDIQRSKMIENAAVCIFLGGSQGTYEEFLLAKKHKKFCIPVGISGGSTKNRIIKEYFEYYEDMCDSNNVDSIRRDNLLKLIKELSVTTEIKSIIEILFSALDSYHDCQIDDKLFEIE